MSYLITGGAGFVGSHLIDSLIEKGVEAHKIKAIDNLSLGKLENIHEGVYCYKDDAQDSQVLKTLIKRHNIETIYNLATRPLINSFNQPLPTYYTSINIASKLAELLKEKTYKRLIHFSSSEVYGSLKYVPMDEGHPQNPLTPYGAGKAAADQLLKSYHTTFDINVTILRPFNMYGPRQNTGSYAAVVPLTIKKILAGEKPIIEGSGTQTRDFTYVKDVTNIAADLTLDLKDRELAGDIINLGQGEEIKIKDIIKRICKTMDYNDPIEYAPERRADVKRHFSNINKAKALLGYEPKTGLKNGMKWTVDWYKGNLG